MLLAGMGWWYGFWLLSKFIVLGTVVSSVWEPVTNATTVLVLYVVDVVLHIVFHPDNEWNELLKNVYSGSASYIPAHAPRPRILLLLLHALTS